MATRITVAQIKTLRTLTETDEPGLEVRIRERYSSGVIILYSNHFRATIQPNGDWRADELHTGKLIAKGTYR